MEMRYCLANAEDAQAGILFTRLMRIWHGVKVLPGDIESGIKVKRDDSLPEEGFHIKSNGKSIEVSGNGRRGVAYGMAELAKQYGGSKQYGENVKYNGNKIPEINITQSPAMPFRGIHLYMPAKEDVDAFYRLIDMMIIMKHNTLILEVGGGMEYKNHPEINLGWERFCKQIESIPGGPNAFAGSDSYWKDSTHTELGGGSFLPQDTVREIVQYAKAYGLAVTPELQMCSHSYYITTVYPQFAERAADYYPDTVCPLNEDAYKLYFELAEEVLDVFEPEMVSVGHDEIRVMGHCDACKQKTGHELLAYEINRLHEFYSSRGVKIAMWCEKLQEVTSYYIKKTFGGTEENNVDIFGRKWHLPATNEAIKSIPKDILLLDWYYGWSWDSQEQAQENGFNQIFGNFHGEWTRGWDRRKASSCVKGGQTSSWCLANESTLGHDNILGDFWFSAMVLWNKEYNEEKYDNYLTQMRYELPRFRELLQDRPSLMSSYKPENTSLLFVSGSIDNFEIERVDLPGLPVFKTLCLPSEPHTELRSEQSPEMYGNTIKLPEKISGTLVGESEIFFPVNKKADRVLFVHSSLANYPASKSYNLDKSDRCPVIYAIRYADGETLFAKAWFGVNIGNIKMKPGRKPGYEGKTPEDPYGFGTTADECPDPPLYIPNDPWQGSLLYSAAPFISGDNCIYLMEWMNPKPGVEIDKIYAMNMAETKEEQAILYCVIST